MTTKGVLFSTGALLPLVIVVLALTSPLAKGATAGELLEKAIYAEETTGNLDEAIKLYEQVIAEAKTAKSAAAKAQYRLGLIYEKQGKAELAAAAFRAVVENFPDEKDLVAQARKRLPSELKLLPAPWREGDELQLNMKLAAGLDIGTMIYRIEAAKTKGKEVWHCTTRGLVTANGANSVSQVMCDKETFAPITSLWRHSMLGYAEAIYSDDSVRIQVEGKAQPVVIKFTPPVFDNEQAMQLFRRLPLKVGYKTTVNVVSSLGSGEVKLGVEVPEMETIETSAGKFECYKLVLNIGQTFWISNDEHRYVARFSAGGVTADLAKIAPLTGDGAVKGDGFSLALPKDWHDYRPDAGGDEKKTIFLLDADAIATSSVHSGPLDSLKEDERVSAKAWTESAMKEMKKLVKDFKLRDPGIEEVKVGERIATSIVADFTEDGKKMTMYGVAVLTDARAVNLRFKAPADKFEELKPAFDSIVKSLKVE
jgi:hypothetical protein